MSATFNLAGLIIEHDGAQYRFEREMEKDRFHFVNTNSGGMLQIPDPTNGGFALPSLDWFLTAYRDGTLSVIEAPLPDAVRALARRQQLEREELETDDPMARLRAFIVRSYDKTPVPRSQKRIEAWLTELCLTDDYKRQFGAVRPSARSVIRWVEKRGRDFDRRLADCMSMSGRVPRQRRLHPLVESRLNHHALNYYTNGGRKVKDVFLAVAADIHAINEGRPLAGERQPLEKPPEPLIVPSYETVRAAVRRLENSDTISAKFGKRASRLHYGHGGRPERVTRLLERTYLDDCKLPGIICVDLEERMPIGMPTFTALIEAKTRCVLGWDVSFEPASFITAGRAIIHSNLPKSAASPIGYDYPALRQIFGKSDTIVLDNTLFHLSTGMEEALAEAGISLQLSGVDEPTHKAVVERFFGTINTLLIQKLPGAMLDIPRMRDYAYDPTKQAVVTREELLFLLEEAIGVYHVTAHEGLDGRSPLAAWQKEVAKAPVNILADSKRLESSFCLIEENRTLRGSGLRAFGLVYSDHLLTKQLLNRLVPLENRRRRTKRLTAKVKIKYDPADIGKIQVYDVTSKTYVTLPCTHPDYAVGLPLWLHDKLRRFAREEGEECVSQAQQLAVKARFNAMIEDIAPHLKMRERRILGRLHELQERGVLGSAEHSVHKAPTDFEGTVPNQPSRPRRRAADPVDAQKCVVLKREKLIKEEEKKKSEMSKKIARLTDVIDAEWGYEFN